MEIQCFNDRYESLQIPMGGILRQNRPVPALQRSGEQRVYAFKRNGANHLVCEVDHAPDLRRLLQIREGYAPYGDDAKAEAEERFGWSKEPLVLDEEDAAAAGQPEVATEMVDDDEVPGDNDVEDDDDDETEPALVGDLPAVPAEDADGDDWMAYGRSLPGVEDPRDKKQLEKYALDNYGFDLNRRLGHIKLLKQIGALQSKSVAG